MSIILLSVFVILGAYLLGSISSAILVCRMLGLPDPRSEGSGNPGATNVLRIGGAQGKRAAAITLLGDSLKGLLPMLIAHTLQLAPWAVAATGLAAFLGHLYPVFFGFRGGKGVATALGVQFGLAWPLGLFVAAVWLFLAKVAKISSAAALVSMLLAPFALWLITPEPAFLLMQLSITALLFWRHRRNIRDLLAGTERPIGQ